MFTVRVHADGMLMRDDFVTENEDIAYDMFDSARDYYHNSDTGTLELCIQLIDESDNVLAESLVLP